MTKIDRSKPQDFGVSYMQRALTDVNGIIADIRKATKGVKYDTIVVTGSSGMMVGPILARALRKRLFVVRKKPEFQSSHSRQKFLGSLGHRWIFVDDFCSSGETFKRVRDGVREAVNDINVPRSWWDQNAGHTRYEGAADIEEFQTDLVGYFEYQKPSNGEGEAAQFTPWDEDAKPGYSDAYWADTPMMIAEKQRQQERRIERDNELKAGAAPRYEKEIAIDVTTPKVPAYKATLAQAVGDYRATLAKVRAEQICDEPNCIVCTEEAKSIMAETADRVPATLKELMNS